MWEWSRFKYTESQTLTNLSFSRLGGTTGDGGGLGVAPGLGSVLDNTVDVVYIGNNGNSGYLAVGVGNIAWINKGVTYGSLSGITESFV